MTETVDNTLVLDIKPIMAKFLPRGPVGQPEGSRGLIWADRQLEFERGDG
jgi:hypothetical protein